LEQCTKGRATLLGDAAHPLLPYLGQSACQAMEDGCVLAKALAHISDDLPGALQLSYMSGFGCLGPVVWS
jgi:2-polyprenyl-6-methoxyphenol hydroxylase-like FAD-dependent oxidoreductase